MSTVPSVRMFSAVYIPQASAFKLTFVLEGSKQQISYMLDVGEARLAVSMFDAAGGEILKPVQEVPLG